ncbi:MAG: TetR/AcrR family transcriptional regulator [Archangium sp.]|nr:TetR/AcrR family transcriptional regulator [Archangium sp.]MDP3154783.1 TetR/AcrR family transcriptional regulator [Archangium sp.]MDP3573673.1 TetR/AcrR family transcriptional regulator [Archangium sp.]
MPSIRSESPRKKPTQARAQHTVESILRATAHILRTAGWDACNTNAVAKRAGVSIGSLYQYFPSKESLVTALAEEHAARGLGVLMEAVSAASGGKLSFEQTVRHYIRAMVALHAVDPKLHRVLMEQVPRLKGGLDVMRRVSTPAAALVRSWLETQRKHLRAVDLDVATFTLVTAVEAVSHLQMLERPAKLDQELMVEELSQLVLGYLKIPPPPGPPGRAS